jgi:hypothetical protein
MTMRHLFLAVIAGAWAAALAATFQFTMDLPATPRVAAPQPLGWVYTEQGYIPYYGNETIPYGYGGRIIPAPEIVSAPGYVPLMIRPVPPQPRHFRIHRGQIETWPADEIHRLPRQGVQFQTDGYAVYGLPEDGPQQYIVIPRW